MTVLPELERTLAKAVRRDERRAQAHARVERRPRLVTLPQRAVVQWAAFAALAAALVGGGVLATHGQPATGSRYDAAPETRHVQTGGGALTAGSPPPAAVVARFGVLGAPRGQGDTLGDRDRGALGVHVFADQVHRAATPAPLDGPGRAATDEVFVSGGIGDTVCLLILPPLAQGPTGECLAPQTAVAGRLVMTLEHGREVEIAGVVPDGVERVTVTLASGVRATLPVTGNAYSALLPGPTTAVSFQGADGVVSVDVPS